MDKKIKKKKTPKNDDDDDDDNKKKNELTISSADIIRLVQAHLMESGLHESCRVLQQESGIGLAGAPPRLGSAQWRHWAVHGQWASILKVLSMMDLERCRSRSSSNSSSNSNNNNKKQMQDLMAEVHEMAILEVAAVGDLSVAYATYRLAQPLLQQQPQETNTATAGAAITEMTRARVLEQKLAALAATAATATTSAPLLAEDYYGPGGKTRDEVRLDLGRRLEAAFAPQPSNRLTSLLQQAIKYESYTGQLPQVKQYYSDDDDDDNEDDKREEAASASQNNEGEPTDKKSKKKGKRKKRKYFDLVLGTTSTTTDPVVAGGESTTNRGVMSTSFISRPDATIKFGKSAYCEAALFLPDASLATGSSDGLIEIWDASQKYNALRMDLPYQQADNLLGHDGPGDADNDSSTVAVTALAVAKDGSLLASGTSTGQVKVWRVDTGKCLRTMQCHSASTTTTSAATSSSRSTGARITCLSFSPDAGRLLTASQDGACREFGLRTAKMLQQFTTTTGGHDYVSSCFYHVLNNVHDNDHDKDKHEADDDSALFVVTGSADGMVRFFHARTGQLYRIWRPISFGPERTRIRQSIRVLENHPSATAAADSSVDGSPAIQAVVSVHIASSPSSSSLSTSTRILIVPRGHAAYLVNHAGVVERVFQDDPSTGSSNNAAASSSTETMDGKVFCAATVSASHQWLYAIRQDGACCIFNLSTGKLERTVEDFALESTSKSKQSQARVAEITTVTSHPFKSNMIAACSNDKGQKRGTLVVWK
jgi:WD40 repeat-containing protein SMU1